MFPEPGMKILIVDDNADDRRLLRLTLERQGARVFEAGDGVQGLECARSQRPELIISDALMPRLDGFQLLQGLKADPDLQGIPFVFHSAIYTGSKDAELALALGAEAFISKPKEPGEFLRELASVMGELATEKRPAVSQLSADEMEYLRRYSSVVAAKLETKVRELETALTRSREAEAALQAQFAQFSTIFDALNALVYVADLASEEILFMNRYGAMLVGEDWQGKSFRELFGLSVEEKERPASASAQPRDASPEQALVGEFLCPVNGRWYQRIDRVIPWPDGRQVRLQIAFDITERKELERIRDEMISAVSHEMRTPLTSLLGYTEYMLGAELSTAEMRKYLEIVAGEAGRLSELIGTFLELQRQRAVRNTAGFRPLAVRPLLEAVVGRFAPLAPQHRFRIDCPDRLPPLYGEAVLLGRMLEMLVSNAVKFSPEGGEVELAAALEDETVRLQVTDQGIGIPAEELEHIFEPFYRLDNSDRRAFGGTGLGLTLVREVVQGHGGRVWAEHRTGGGSRFFVVLPIYRQAQDGAEPLNPGELS